MRRTTTGGPARRGLSALVALAAVALSAATAAPVAPPASATPEGEAAEPGKVIVLPGASSAEGIAAGRGSTFYAGDYFRGDIYRGDAEAGTAARLIDVPRGRHALGMAAHPRHDLLFVGGGRTGQAYVYDIGTGRTVASYRFGPAGTTFVNDVTLTRSGAWFTDSRRARLYFVPVDRHGKPGRSTALRVSGPAAGIKGPWNLNGIQATPDGRTLIVAHSAKGALYTVDPASGRSAAIAGVSVPRVDGIVLHGHTLWAVQGFRGQVRRIALNSSLTSGKAKKTIKSGLFRTPSTAARFGNTLAVVNAKLHTGTPPTAKRYEVVMVDG
ncbi:SMP-30/gluconolactonase/LRE family protein [Streptomyces chrestomyceticus]|uniref:SMP-30/gluconolactonase/LRE family protein n=1 Tax=Streptomyces chrestomyceticus TaxID=68185 RepID=UPI0036B3DAA8